MPANNGNRSKPVEQKRRLGNPGHQKLVPVGSVTVLPPAQVSVPEHLGVAGRSAFEHVASMCPWLAPSDMLLLVSMCEQIDEVAKWKSDVVARGEVIETPNGTLQAHPLLAHIRDARKQIASSMSLLGLSPSDRGRIGAGEVKAVSKLAQILEAERKA